MSDRAMQEASLQKYTVNMQKQRLRSERRKRNGISDRGKEAGDS